MKFSVIVHVVKTQSEMKYLFDSLKNQTHQDFEVILVQDCKGEHCETIYLDYKKDVDVKFFNKPEAGEGYSLNFALEQASGDFFVILDPDTFLPPEYFSLLKDLIEKEKIDAFKGQVYFGKPGILNNAYKFAEREFIGIAGKRKYFSNVCNSGFSKEVFLNTEGFVLSESGGVEEYFLRLDHQKYTIAFPEQIFVIRTGNKLWHVLKNDFYKLGSSVVNLSYSNYFEYSFFHFLPLICFVIVLGLSVLLFFDTINLLSALILLLIFLGLLTFSVYKRKNVLVGILSIFIFFTQIGAYSIGLISEAFRSASR